MPREQIHLKISRKLKSTKGIPIHLKSLQEYKKMEKQEGLQYSPPPQRQEGINHWPPEETPLVVRHHPTCFQLKHKTTQKQWFLLGLTSTLVVRKRRGLSWQIWHTYQDRSINALVYHPQRTASSRLKGLHQHQASRRNAQNWRLRQATRKEATTPSQQRGPEMPRLFKTSTASWKPSNSCRIFLCMLGSLTLLTLKVSWQGFDKILSAMSTLQLSTSANEDNLHLRQKRVFDATQIIAGELGEQ
jgi:hypothetical protein